MTITKLPELIIDDKQIDNVEQSTNQKPTGQLHTFSVLFLVLVLNIFLS